MFGSYDKSAQTPEMIAAARQAVNSPPVGQPVSRGQLLPMAQGVSPPQMQDPMAARMIGMNPNSGLSMMRRPSGPMNGSREPMPQGMAPQQIAPAQQISALTPEQRDQMIAQSLSGAQQVENPLQGAAMMVNALSERNRMMAQNSGFPQGPKTMGNLFGIANAFGAPKMGGGLY